MRGEKERKKEKKCSKPSTHFTGKIKMVYGSKLLNF
jgi:hypothetical protein